MNRRTSRCGVVNISAAVGLSGNVLADNPCAMKELDGELSDTPQWMKVGWRSAALKTTLSRNSIGTAALAE